MRRCLREPIPEIFEAASYLNDAVDAHFEGDRIRASRLLQTADIPAIAAWTDSVWGKYDPEIHWKIEPITALPFLAKVDRPMPRMPTTATKKIVIDRDGYHCRFCGIPVISSEIRRRLRDLYPDAIRWGRQNKDQHAALQCLWLQYDHVIPNQRGGASTPDNIIITCGPCNFGRMERSVEEMGLFDPTATRYPPKWDGHAAWDGLSRLTQSP
jgi:5-methylcytosine-specific restriction endonuclease McrA